MSTDYYVTIKRKSDNKKIASFIANSLKNIMDSSFSEIIHCDGRSADKAKFTTDELNAVEESAHKAVDAKISEIVKTNLMVALAKNKAIKYELEEDLRYMTEDLHELNSVASSAAYVYGMIACLVEDQMRGNKAAYEYNAKDLPKKKGKYGDGTEYECGASLWCSDVYCEIEASY